MTGATPYDPYLQEYMMMAEFRQLQKQCFPGVYVVPSYSSPLTWNGFMFLRCGLYEGCALRFQLTVPANYPDGDCPDFMFEFPIFHPMVDASSGKVNLAHFFPVWQENQHYLWHVLERVQKMFLVIETDHPLNTEAASLYEQDMELFRCHVSASVQTSRQCLMQAPSSGDPFAIRFSPWTSPVHCEAKRNMLDCQSVSHRRISYGVGNGGLSWMVSGSSEIFNREETT